MAARQVELASAAAWCEQVFVLQNNEGLNEEQSLDYGNEHEFTKVLEYSPFPRYRGIIYILTSFGHLCVCLLCVCVCCVCLQSGIMILAGPAPSDPASPDKLR